MYYKDEILVDILNQISVALAGTNLNQEGYNKLSDTINDLKRTLEIEFSSEDYNE